LPWTFIKSKHKGAEKAEMTEEAEEAERGGRVNGEKRKILTFFGVIFG